MVRGGYMETNEVGDFEWYTMAVAKPCKIPNGLAMQMITMLWTHNVHDLAPRRQGFWSAKMKRLLLHTMLSRRSSVRFGPAFALCGCTEMAAVR